MDLYDIILEELKHRQSAQYERFPRFFIASIGAHLFNLANQEKRFYWQSGLMPNTRMHIMFVSPPGFSGTFWLEQFLRTDPTIKEGAMDSAILKDSGIDITFEGSMTEAGFVGTVKFVDSAPVITAGAAQMFNKSIIGIEEFSAITTMMQAQHSRLLDSAMLSALDKGYVIKHLAGGRISYRTNLTLWCKTQPARYDLSSGLGRRFFFLNFIPTRRDREEVDDAYERGKNIRADISRLLIIREKFKELRERINNIEMIGFDAKIRSYLKGAGIIHYERMLYEKMLIGYAIMRGRFDKELFVTLDDESMKMVKLEIFWRDQIRRGAQYAQVFAILRDNDGHLPEWKIKEELLLFGMDWSQGTQVLDELVRLKALRRQAGEVFIKEEMRQGEPR